MQLVIPMAGLGQRFVDAGYKLPKPLVPVDDVPMVVRAVRELPPSQRQVFVVHPDHVCQYHIDAVLKEYFPTCKVIETPGLTRGQACTVRIASEHLDPNLPVLVAACDNSHLYRPGAFKQRTSAGVADCLVWTYRNDFRVLAKPEAHGWVDTRGSSSQVVRVSCKKPISKAPLGDHAISGCFWFRSAKLMQESIDQLVASGETVNNEFYLDVVPNLLVGAGRRVEVFEVEKYIGWGTPQDLEDYQRWRRYFAA